MVSDKQKAILTKNGYTEEQIGQMNYQQISEIIGQLLARPIVKKPVFDLPIVPKQKSSFDATSSYTRQSVDIYMNLRTMLHEELGKKNPELIDDKVIMQLAINLVKQAKKEFQSAGE